MLAEICLHCNISCLMQGARRQRNMATQATDDLAPYAIKTLKDPSSNDSEGSGSFGVVYRVKVNGFPCIAKRLHDILVGRITGVQVTEKEKASVQARFREECILLSKLRHPNIVQFIGVHYGRTRDDLTLVMECLYTDLDKCLEKCVEKKQTLPFPLQLSILLDVAYGLLYLHSQEPPIVHRDLKAENVLLTQHMRAKLADLGVSKILDLHPLSHMTRTVCPGTPAVMPPEALVKIPRYDTRLDDFSYGTLILHVTNHEFPMSYEITFADKGHVQIAKRNDSIEKMGRQHCLYDLVIHCLQDDPKKRPTTAEICATVECLVKKYPQPFKDMLEMYKEIEVQEKAKAGLEVALVMSRAQCDSRLKTLQVDNSKLQQQLREKQLKSHLQASGRAGVAQQAEEIEKLNVQVKQRDQEILHLHAQVKQRNQEILHLRTKRSRLQASGTSGQPTARGTSVEVVELQRSLREKEEELARTTAKVEHYQKTANDLTKMVHHAKGQSRKVKELREQLDTVEGEKSQLLSQKDELMVMSQSVKFEINSLQKAKAGLEVALRASENGKERLERLKAQCDSQLKTLQVDNSKLQQQLREKQLKAQQSEQANRKLQEDKNIVEQRGIQLHARIENLAQEAAAFRRKAEELQSTVAEQVARLQEEVLSKTQQVKQYKKQADQYREELEAHKQHVLIHKETEAAVFRQKAELQSTVTEQGRELQRLQVENASLRDEVMIEKVKSQTFEEDFKQERRDCKQAHNNMAETEQRYAHQLNTMGTELQKTQQELTRHKEVLRDTETLLHGQTQQLQQHLNTKEQEVARLQEEVLAKTQQVKQYKKQADQYREELEAHKQHVLIHKETETAVFRQKAEELQSTVTEQGRELQRIQVENASLRDEVMIEKKPQGNLTTKPGNLASVSAEDTSSETVHSKPEEMVAVQQREIPDLRHSLSEAHKKIETLTQELANTENERDETIHKYMVIKEDLESELSHVSSLQSKVAQLNESTVKWMVTVNTQTEKINVLQHEVNFLKKENEALKKSSEAKTFEEDFKQERSDRKAAHSKIADVEQHYTRQLTATEKQLQESQTQLEIHKLALANTERAFGGNLERMQVMLREKENEVAKLGKELERRDRRIEVITRKRKLTDIERENKQLQDEHIVLRDENQELRMMLGMESSLEMSGKQPRGPLSQHASSSEAIKEGRDYRALTAVYENFFLMHSCQLVAVFEAKGMKRYDAEKLVCFMFMSAYREIIDQMLQEMTASLRSLFTVSRYPPDLGAILAPYIQLRRACSLDAKREEITTAIQEQVWEKLANPDPTLKEDVPNIDQALQTCTPDLKEILDKATSLAWDLLATLPPMIAKEPPQYNEDIHTYSFHFWDDSLAEASLKYFQPVLYRNCMGELAAKGTVANTRARF